MQILNAKVPQQKAYGMQVFLADLGALSAVVDNTWNLTHD